MAAEKSKKMHEKKSILLSFSICCQLGRSYPRLILPNHGNEACSFCLFAARSAPRAFRLCHKKHSGTYVFVIGLPYSLQVFENGEITGGIDVTLLHAEFLANAGDCEWDEVAPIISDGKRPAGNFTDELNACAGIVLCFRVV